MNPKLKKHICQKLRTLRFNHGVSQVELAKHLKTTANTVSRWETGIYNPSVEDLWNMSKYFKIHISEFFPQK